MSQSLNNCFDNCTQDTGIYFFTLKLKIKFNFFFFLLFNFITNLATCSDSTSDQYNKKCLTSTILHCLICDGGVDHC